MSGVPGWSSLIINSSSRIIPIKRMAKFLKKLQNSDRRNMSKLFLFGLIFPTFISARLIPKDMTHLSMQDDAKCVMSGVCGGVSETLGYVPCSQTTDHHKFVDDDSHMIKVLRDECPELFSTNDENEMPEVCCTAQELREMQARIKYFMTWYGGCDSCLAHTKQIICHIGCAPNQNKFLRVTESEAVDPASNLHKVSDVQYYISETFMAATFERCKKIPKVWEQLNKTECAGDMDKCTPKMLAEIWGMKGENVQYQLNIILSDDPVTDGDGRTFIPAPLMIQDKCTSPDCDKTCPQ